MAIDTTLITEYTPAQIIAACAQARMMLLIGGTELKMPDGRTIKRPTADEINKIEQAAYAAMNSDASDGNVLVNRRSAV